MTWTGGNDASIARTTFTARITYLHNIIVIQDRFCEVTIVTSINRYYNIIASAVTPATVVKHYWVLGIKIKK